MNNQIPDWQEYFTEVTDDQVRVFEDIDELRANDPILWALVTDSRSAKGIARKLCYPLMVVLTELRLYKEHGLVMDEQGVDGVIWRLEGPNLIPLREFALNIRRHMQEEEPRDGSV